MSINSEEDFIRIVKKAEQDASNNLSLYKTKLALFGIIGYLVIFTVLIVLVVMIGGLVGIAMVSTSLFLLLVKKKLIFAILFAIWMLIRSLWVSFEAPKGRILKRKEYPELFEQIDTLTKQIDSLKIHKVILDERLNAAVVQHPRLGILGWHENTLFIGLQLLIALSPEEMQSVLAHEFGHLSGNHSRFSAWIYRVRLRWQQVMDTFDKTSSWGARLMSRFFNWYAPQFAAYSFALARNNEYEADGISAELTTPEIATKALVNVYATSPYIESNYWDQFYEFADKLSEPPHAPFEGLADFLADNPLSQDEVLAKIKAEMQIETHYSDTHPSLKDRVDAIGAAPQLPVAPKINAAKAWLGKQYQAIMQEFDQKWLDDNQEQWKNRHEYVTKAQTKLKEFSQQEHSALNDEDLWNYAFWTHEFSRDDTALPLFMSYQERYPQDTDAAYFVGRLLLNRNDAGGIDHLRVALKDPNRIEDAARAGYSYLMEQDKEVEADAWWQESLKHSDAQAAVRHERDNISENDEIISPDIDDELLRQLKDNLRQHPKVSKAWLAQKVLKLSPERPIYVVAFAPKGLSRSYGAMQQDVAESLNVTGEIFVVCKNGDTKAMAKKVKKMGRRIL